MHRQPRRSVTRWSWTMGSLVTVEGSDGRREQKEEEDVKEEDGRRKI